MVDVVWVVEPYIYWIGEYRGDPVTDAGFFDSPSLRSGVLNLIVAVERRRYGTGASSFQRKCLPKS
jgi:hypothetical protein